MKQQQHDPQAAEAINAMAPEVRKITAGGKSYEVKRLETRQIWPTLRAGLPIIGGLVALLGIGTDSPAAGSPLGSGTPTAATPPDVPREELSPLAQFVGKEVAKFLEIMAEHGERVTEIVAIGLDEKIATVGRFEPQETYFAIKALIEVNRDFFTHRVAPLLGLNVEPGESVLSGAIGQALKNIGAGATPSSS